MTFSTKDHYIIVDIHQLTFSSQTMSFHVLILMKICITNKKTNGAIINFIFFLKL